MRGRGGVHGKECPGNMLSQVGGELRESEVPWASVFPGVRMKYTSKRLEGNSLVPLNVTRSQGSARRSCGRGPALALSHSSLAAGARISTTCLWGC